MKLFKDIARAIYAFATTEQERQNDYLAALATESRAKVALGYFKREAPLLGRSNTAYEQALHAAESLVLLHNNATSFNQMCRSHVRRTAGSSYFQTVTLGILLAQVIDREEGKPAGGETAELLVKIADDLVAAAAEKSFVKRRSIIRNAIKAKAAGLSADDLTLAVELVISIAPEFKA